LFKGILLGLVTVLVQVTFSFVYMKLGRLIVIHIPGLQRTFLYARWYRGTIASRKYVARGMLPSHPAQHSLLTSMYSRHCRLAVHHTPRRRRATPLAGCCPQHCNYGKRQWRSCSRRSFPFTPGVTRCEPRLTRQNHWHCRVIFPFGSVAHLTGTYLIFPV
jgi:hypothetical protein